MLLIHDASMVENTDRGMRWHSPLVQLSKKRASFSSTKETKLEKIHAVGKLYHFGGFEEYLKIDEMCQQPPGHLSKNDKDYCYSTM